MHAKVEDATNITTTTTTTTTTTAANADTDTKTHDNTRTKFFNEKSSKTNTTNKLQLAIVVESAGLFCYGFFV